MKKLLYLFALTFFLSCSISIPPLIQNNKNQVKPNDLMIFFDGTSNTPKSNTNIFKLYNLKQCRDNVSSFYTVGVGGGVDFKFLGMGLGTGIGNDVRDAYKFICENYDKRRQDRLHFFGFSRGGYSSIILSNLIYVAGVLDLSEVKNEKTKEKIIAKIYRAYRGEKTYSNRKKNVNTILNKFEKKLNIRISSYKNVTIETLNLFDVVEALSAPDYTERNFCTPNKNHLAQLINVKNVLHAVSLDDNRARIFTPILQTCNEIQTNRDLNTFVNEVWFSGAHADVGGGYDGYDDLQNVSLNWMLSQLKDRKLFTEFEFKGDDIFGVIHDAESSNLLFDFLYRKRERDIKMFINENYNNGKLKIHNSVIKRLENKKYHNNRLARKVFWFDDKMINECFTRKNDSLRIFNKENCNYIQVVNDKDKFKKDKD